MNSSQHGELAGDRRFPLTRTRARSKPQRLVRTAARLFAALSLLGSCTAAPHTATSLPAGFATRPQTFLADRWTAEEGLPTNSLSSLMYGHDGYLWIGTLAGSERFDGVRFSPILDSLPNAHIRALLEDRRGHIWAGLVNAGLAHYHDRHTEVLPPERLAGADVRALAEDSEGRIWVGTDHGLSVVDAAGAIAPTP